MNEPSAETAAIARRLRVDHRAPLPVYCQLVEGVKELVYRGELAEGARLPTVRALAGALDINPNTVARAYQELEREGLVNSRVGRGTFVLPAKDGAEAAGSETAKRRKLEALWREMREKSLEMGLTGGELFDHLKTKLKEEVAARRK